MVADIDSGPGSSFPSDITPVGAALFFQATDGTNGVELWTSDGTGAGTAMVEDIDPGPASSFPSGMVDLGGVLYFDATDGTHGTELWTSDGTGPGTDMVVDIDPGPGGSFPGRFSGLVDLDGTLSFDADDGTHGTELWSSDGTGGGTTMVADIDPGDGGSTPSWIVVHDGTLFFSATDGLHGMEPWSA